MTVVFVTLTNNKEATLNSGSARAHDCVTLKRTHNEAESTADLTLQIILQSVERVVMGVCLGSASALPFLGMVPCFKENPSLVILVRCRPVLGFGAQAAPPQKFSATAKRHVCDNRRGFRVPMNSVRNGPCPIVEVSDMTRFQPSMLNGIGTSSSKFASSPSASSVGRHTSTFAPPEGCPSCS